MLMFSLHAFHTEFRIAVEGKLATLRYYTVAFLLRVGTVLPVAVRVGFEPTELLHSLVFKTSAISLSATSPLWYSRRDLNP